jgi:hypothetical protein
MGTVIGQEEFETPAGLKFPKSFNKEILENAPQIIIFEDQVNIKFLDKKIPIQTIRSRKDAVTLGVAKEVQKYVEEIPATLKTSGVLLNLVADSKIPYSIIFDISRFFRENGFQSILFVAEGK